MVAATEEALLAGEVEGGANGHSRVPEDATSPRQMSSDARSRLDRAGSGPGAVSRPASASSSLMRSSHEQRRSVRSSLERFEERRSLRRTEGVETGGGSTCLIDKDVKSGSDCCDDSLERSSGSVKHSDGSVTSSESDLGSGTEDFEAAHGNVLDVVVPRPDLAFRFGGNVKIMGGEGAAKEMHTTDESSDADMDHDEKVAEDARVHERQQQQKKRPVMPALPSGGGRGVRGRGGGVKAITGNLAFNFGSRGVGAVSTTASTHQYATTSTGIEEQITTTTVFPSQTGTEPIAASQQELVPSPMHGCDDAGSVVWRVVLSTTPDSRLASPRFPPPVEDASEEAKFECEEGEGACAMSKKSEEELDQGEEGEGTCAMSKQSEVEELDQGMEDLAEVEDDEHVYDDDYDSEEEDEGEDDDEHGGEHCAEEERSSEDTEGRAVSDEDDAGEEEVLDVDNAADEASRLFFEEHGMSKEERVAELVDAMSHTELKATSLVGAESFGLLYDFLARRAEVGIRLLVVYHNDDSHHSRLYYPTHHPPSSTSLTFFESSDLDR